MTKQKLSALTLALFASTAHAIPEVERMWLIDTDTDTRIQELSDYQKLTLPLLANNLSIEAEVNGETDSVVMEIDHAFSSQENYAPYSLVGDSSGDFAPATELQTPGWISISATPWSENNASGVAGEELTLSLYLYQPDFQVNNPYDIGDYEPGDGYCSIKPVYKIEPWITTKLPTTPFEPIIDLDYVDNSHLIEKQSASDFSSKYPDEEQTRAVYSEVDLIQSENQEYLPLALAEFSKQKIDVQRIPDGLIAEITKRYGNCTLRAAIEESNALSGNQSVLIDGTIGTFNITKGHLHIRDGLTLNGHEMPLIDAGDRSRVFYVGNEDESFIVNMNKLDIANGDAGNFRGGAIYVDTNTTLQINDSIIRDSRANIGGGIYVQQGSATLRRSAIHNNEAGHPDSFGGGGITQRGGGISSVYGTVKIYDSSIYDNRAVRGGGLSNFGGTMRVENSSVVRNEAMAIGGGIENHDNFGTEGKLHLNFATVAHNEAGLSTSAATDKRSGGGLYNDSWAFMANSITL